MTQRKWSRREILRGMSLASAAVAGSTLLRPRRSAHAQSQNADDKRRFLIVLCASGGASMIDAMLALRESEVSAAAGASAAATLNCFPDSLVQNIDDSPFRAVDLQSNTLASINMPFSANQSNFVRKHKDDMMVATWTRTSVNHGIGQRRSVTGNEAWKGRTMQEIAALSFGQDLTLPNVHLVTGSACTERGNDSSLPANCFGETIPNPALWPLALDGAAGITHPVDPGLLARARALRDTKLEPNAAFHQAFGHGPALSHWRDLRGPRQQAIENADLIRKLMLFTDEELPLSAHGLNSSPDAQLVRERFPAFANDPLHAQAALSFLLLKHGVSSAVTMGVGFDAVFDGDVELGGGALPEGSIKNPPIAFDFSHQGHRSSQAFMWDRMLGVADSLIDLLKSQEYGNGESFWDRSLIYLASDFGRSKLRPSNAEDFGSGHDLNNGVLVLSPMARGNTVLGGVDPATGLTYGFDPRTGAPEPGRNMSEAEIFAGVIQALGVDTSGSGLPDMPAMRR
ncbi:hypothetical protein [Haliangium ochraceum]|uniref:DUF1501 domain-containing protein n=1 Tax=Haliangium ochraceum (strain DSM 14365 / JCM 11303 / SMP-2) TaxID=502025 RepID=D0LYN8_HALO1|nr:hypothetical protein [Haliangium ochraceum]ACY17904.1 hypothetical protein Hoch_5420 [Haliangium ochraceum DSM 14365]